MRAVVAAAVAVLVIGCTSTNPPAVTPAQTPTPAPTVAPQTPTAAPTLAPLPSATLAPLPSASASTSAAPRPTLEAGVLDPCSLLDPALDLAGVGGSTAPQHLSSPTDWGPQCDYPTPNGVVQVVTFRPAVSDSVFESADNKIEVSALGDLAFYDVDWHRLRVRVGTDRFQVSCFCILPTGTEQALLAQLATSAVAHLASR